MANASDIREHLAQLLSEQISLDMQGDEASQRFAYAIEHALSRFSEDSGELRQLHSVTPAQTAIAFQSGSSLERNCRPPL
jgi:hypothetical protein